MGSFIAQRSLQSLIRSRGLIIAVFFLARLTGDPANLYLPIDASVEARQEFRDKYGFSDPLIVQFGRFLGDLASGDLGESIRKSRPAIEVVLEAMPTTLKLAGITMGLALALAIVVGSLAAYRPGGAVRPRRLGALAARRQRARLLDRDQRHHPVRGDAGLAADLGHGPADLLDHADRRAAACGRSACSSRWCAAR